MGAGAKATCNERPVKIQFRGNKAAGQAVLEMVLILPILLLLIVGALEFGRLFYAKIVVTNAAREGAYYLSTHPDDKTVCVSGVCYQGTLQAVKDEANHSGVTVNNTDITVCSGCSSTLAKVTVQTVVNNVLLLSWIDTGARLSGKNGSMIVTSTVEMMNQ